MASTAVTPATADGDIPHRLPSAVRAQHYDVTLQPDLEARTFVGDVVVTLKLAKATKVLHLNSIELEIQSATVGDAAASKIELNEKDEVATFSFDNELPAGEIKMRVKYTGILNDQMRGFYASTYTTVGGKEETKPETTTASSSSSSSSFPSPPSLLVTQFEATDCRRALPCIDEPAQKATFIVTLITPTDMTAISNMPCKSSTPVGDDGKLTRHTFDITPIMSTYLLAFCVGKFDMIEGKTSSGVIVRCFATPGKGEQNRFALEVAVKLLPYYDEWFAEKYPLPLLQMVAVPDFSAGAMENWGLVTYREAAVLLDPANSSTSTKQYVAVCVAHELSHQWFGNLVTMEWWTDLWLNEGFATWCENSAVDFLYPEWRMWEQFVYSDLNSAFDLDSLENSHPIEVPVGHASEVDEIFDTISYCKGCVVIRMLADFMGEKDFRTGLMKYMKRFKYGNTVTADLWAVLSEVSGKDVRGMMEAWTKQTGFPILSLEENSSADPNVLTFKASQRRFLQTGISHGDKSIWPAPVNFLVSSSSSPVGSQVFSSPDGTLTVDLKAAGVKEPPTWIKLNAAQAGMYRVRYPPKMFAALCEAVKAQDPLLTPADRLGIQNDAFAFARCGLLPTVQLLQLLEAYENERDYTVWADLVSNLGEISSLVAADSETTALFSVYVNALLKKILASIGWDKKPDEDHTTSLLRAKIIAVSAKHGESSTVQTALQKFAAFYGSGQATASVEAASGSKDAAVTLSPDLRSSVYAAVVKHGGLFGYESLLYLGSKVTLSEEQVRCLNALGAASDPELLRRTLAYVLSPSVRTQDGPSAISIVAANGKGGDLCWEFCKQNWDAILKKFQQSSSLSRIVGQCGNFATRAKKADVEAFFASHAHPGAERAVKQAVERIESNAQWLERDGKAISEYLQKFADAQKKA